MNYKVLKSTQTKLGNKIELLGNENITQGCSLVIGVFHGDEPQGKYLIEKYLSNPTYPPLEGGAKSLISGWDCLEEHFTNLSLDEEAKSSTFGENYNEKNSSSPNPPLEGGSKSSISGWGYSFASHKFSEKTKLYAKELRNNTTLHEKILWKYLRKNQFLGLKFRRQQPVGNYIVDFLCCNPKIIIELDGGQHSDNQEYDICRDKYLIKKGYKVIRIWNNYICNNINGVLAYLGKEIKDPTPKSKISTLPQGEGREKSIHYNPTTKSDISTLPQEEGKANFLNDNFNTKSDVSALAQNNIIFIPCLNPDGMQLGKRTNANGVDLNRNFPTKNWGEDTSSAGSNPADYFGGKSAGSEIETLFVMEIIEQYKPSKILTLHAPYKVVNYDGPAENLAQKISEIIKYPVEASIGYPTPGSFGTYAGVERQISTITLELDEICPVENLIEPVFQIFNVL